jgi:hypothetical protein
VRLFDHKDRGQFGDFTGFYGHPDPSRRHESWDLLTHLKGFTPDPWLCVGDFNEVVEQSEKVGGI